MLVNLKIPDHKHLSLVFSKVLHTKGFVFSALLGIASTTQSFLAFGANAKFFATFRTSDKLPVFVKTLERFLVFSFHIRFFEGKCKRPL